MRKDLYGIIAVYALMTFIIMVIIPHGFNDEEERSIRFVVFYVLPPFILFCYASMVQDMEKRHHGRTVSLGNVLYWMVEAVLGRWVADKLWRVSGE